MRTLVALLALLAASPARAASPEEEAVRRRVAELSALFDKGDARAMASLFTEDATLVNIVGLKGSGRQEIEKLLERIAAPFTKGGMKSELKVAHIRLVGKEAAWVDVEHNFTGKVFDRPMDGTLRVPCLFAKHGATWLLAEARWYTYAPTPPRHPPGKR
jgi:uncharacterized protein (TIGR02246 family)